jgi:hypothetical protein
VDGAWGPMTWQACAPDGACTAVAPSADNDKVLEVGDARIGPMTASPITAVATVARIKPGRGPARLC